jgi:uncharacterized protein involved in response to NO
MRIETVINRKRPISVFALGFRPFFLVAGIAAVVAVVVWLARSEQKDT